MNKLSSDKDKSKKKDKTSKKDKKQKEKDAALAATRATSNGDASSQFGSAANGAKPQHQNNNDVMGGDLNDTDDAQSKQQSPAEIYYAAVSLAMPTPSTALPDPSVDKNLKPIRDDGSAFAQVARSCLQITQFAGDVPGTTTAVCSDGHAVESTHLFHDKTYAKIVSDCFAALIVCCKEHKDRRCRILACQSLALLARSAYARIRHSPLLFTMRDSVLHTLEDEVGSEVPTALLHVALEDGDDGVSATAVEALGTLALATSNANSGTIIDDELLHEIQSMAFARIAPYAPSLRSVLMSSPAATLEEDISVPQLELQSRILRNIMAPRLLQLITRIVHYNNASHHIRMTLPFVTACLIHQVRTNNASIYDMDRATYAKRWVDLDVMGLINDVVTAMLLPSMQSCIDGDLAHTAALCALRLANACPNANWVLEICRWAVVILREELSATGMLESKTGTLATLIIALRAIPLPERAPLLENIVTEIASLPYTIMIPHGVSSPGLMLQTTDKSSNLDKSQSNFGQSGGQEGQSSTPFACYRKPARIALFSELALSIFIDGPLGMSPGEAFGGEGNHSIATEIPPGQRSLYLKHFLSSSAVVNICKEQEDPAIIKMRDEMLLAYTTVAWEVGRRFRVSADGSVIQPPPPTPGLSSSEIEEWTRLAFTTLSIFSPCARWGRRPDYLEEDLELLTAGQSSYIRLLQEFLHFVGLLHPSSSVTFKLTPNACPPHLLWDQMIESASFLNNWETSTGTNKNDNPLINRSLMGCCNDIMAQDVAALVDDFVEKDLRQGIISFHMRMFILTLGVDQWVQGRYVAIRRHIEIANTRGSRDGIIPLSLNMPSARDLLVAVSPKRLLTKLLEYHTAPVDSQGKKKKDPIKKLAAETVRVCVACVENIALTAAEWRRRLGANQESQAIVQMAIASLEGKLDEEPTDESLRLLMGPLCDAAAARIQAFYQTKSNGSDVMPASELVMQPMKYKIKPLVSSSTAKGADREGPAMFEYMNGYLMQLSRQIISSRVDMALFANPISDSYFSCFARPKNWLRLATPPLPLSRDARGQRFRVLAAGTTSSVWGKNIYMITAGSDPVTAFLAHTVSRIPRYDNEDEYRVRVFMQVCNSTPSEITEGLLLQLGLEYQQQDTGMDSRSLEFLAALGGTPEDFQNETVPLVSASSAYKHPLYAGDQLVWEVALNHLAAGKISLHPTIVFRNVAVEPISAFAEMVGGSQKNSKTSRRLSASSVSSQKGEDDFQISTKEKGHGFSGDQTESQNVCLAGDPMRLSPLLGLQPCPLVFFRDAWGDLDTFRFLWFRMPYAVPPIIVKSKTPQLDSGFPPDDDDDDDVEELPEDVIGKGVAEASSLLFEGEAIPGGFATKLWAFMSLAGDRLMCVLTETENNVLSLHLKGDCTSLLYALVGSKESRRAVVAAVTTGMVAEG